MTLNEAGVADVYVVVGADSKTVAAATPVGCRVVEASDWSEGMGASLRAGLGAVSQERPAARAVVVMLVDTPGIGSAVVRRLLETAGSTSLARASFHGLPGHPVLLGREHLAGVIASARGDRGARDYLLRHGVVAVECADLGSGVDIDTPAALAAWSGDKTETPT